MRNAVEYLIITGMFILASALSIYLHDKNVLNQCNARGYTDTLVVGERLACLEIE